MSVNMSVAQAQANLLVVQKQNNVNTLQRKVDDLYQKALRATNEYKEYSKPDAINARRIRALVDAHQWDIDEKTEKWNSKEHTLMTNMYNNVQALQKDAHAANSELQVAKAELELALAVQRNAK